MSEKKETSKINDDEKKPDEEINIEKEISELTEDGSPYWNKTHPNHAKTVDRVFKLREQLNG